MDGVVDLFFEGQANDCCDTDIEEFAFKYVTGFISRHSRRHLNNKCEDCRETIEKPKEQAKESDMHITLKSKGFLTYPSDALVKTLTPVESTILKVADSPTRDKNILFAVVECLRHVIVPLVGCSIHASEFTRKIVKSYLIMRMFFISDRWNQDIAKHKKDKKNHTKLAHLT